MGSSVILAPPTSDRPTVDASSTESSPPPVWVGRLVPEGDEVVETTPSGPATAPESSEAVAIETQEQSIVAEHPVGRIPAAAVRSNRSVRENVAFVRSPTPVLPRLDIGRSIPVAPRLPRGVLHRIPGRKILLLAIVGLAVPALLVPFARARWFTDAPVAPVAAPVPLEIVVSGDRVDLVGSVPSAEVGDALTRRLEDALGADRVHTSTEIHPNATLDAATPTPLRLDETIRFAFGAADVTEQYVTLVDVASRLLAASETSTMTLVGHTDAVGSESENLALSLRRADAVATAIAAGGADPERIEVVGRGESEPVAENVSEDGRAQNRRVEFFIVGLVD